MFRKLTAVEEQFDAFKMFTIGHFSKCTAQNVMDTSSDIEQAFSSCLPCQSDMRSQLAALSLEMIGREGIYTYLKSNTKAECQAGAGVQPSIMNFDFMFLLFRDSQQVSVRVCSTLH